MLLIGTKLVGIGFDLALYDLHQALLFSSTLSKYFVYRRSAGHGFLATKGGSTLCYTSSAVPPSTQPSIPPNMILVLNSGSSSIKFALLEPRTVRRIGGGLAERIGSEAGRILWTQGQEKSEIPIPGQNHEEALARVVDHLHRSVPEFASALDGIGHRVVHGGERFTHSTLIDDDIVTQIEQVSHLAPLHNPANLTGIRTALQLFPDVPQAAVFDTAFHQSLAARAFLYALPYRYYSEMGIRRYGFHGTSHRYVTEKAAGVLGRPLESLALLSAHLGNGCSAAAVLNGQSVDTTMGLTPLEGLVMGTRSGDVDPGLHEILSAHLDIDVVEVTRILNRESGLLGLSGHSNDMRELERLAADGDERAVLAIEIFCYRLARSLASLTVALGRLDGLIFTGGIGENSSNVRRRTLEHLAFLGFDLDQHANQEPETHSGRITKSGGPVALVVPTDEEAMIARDTLSLLTGQRGSDQRE